MGTIPRAVLSDTLRGLLTGRRVTAGVFLTFTFEPQFFEEEVLSLLSDEMASAEPKLRMLQLEELLRSSIGPLSVYYDRAGLRGDGAARQDVRYVPLHVPSGVFHPKVVLLLTEPENEDSNEAASLICGILSANLTKAGWWSNLECFHFETVEAGKRCSYRSDLLSMLRQVRALDRSKADHIALGTIYSFVMKDLQPTEHSTAGGLLRPRIFAGTGSLAGFLAEVRGEALRGKTLEVVSPFFDDHKASPLKTLLTELDVSRAYVYLPKNAEGAAGCSAKVYEDVIGMSGAQWAQFRGEEELLRLGKDKHSKRRCVHAKIYRFTDKETNYEAVLIGSHNLTSAATSKGGNFEVAFFLEPVVERSVERWLETDDKRPKAFDLLDPVLESCKPIDDAVVPLQVKFDWAEPRSCRVLWEGQSLSPILHLSLKGAEVCSCEDLPPGEWKVLSKEQMQAIEERLVSSALLTVSAGEVSGTILVQEEGMARKPSILLSLSPTEVLAYWSRLTVSQRVQYLEERLGSLDAASLEQEGFVIREHLASTSMFETYAGIFHGFEMLREQISKGLETGHEKQADYLLFGDRHDSLPRLLRRVGANHEGGDAVSRYLMVLSAKQLVRWVKRLDSEFVKSHAKDLRDLEAMTEPSEALRAELAVGNDHAKFLDWFEQHFAKRARPRVAEVDD